MYEQLRASLADANASGLREFLAGFPVEEAAHAVSRLDHEEKVQLWAVLPSDEAASLIGSLPLALAAELLNDVEPRAAAGFFLTLGLASLLLTA